MSFAIFLNPLSIMKSNDIYVQESQLPNNYNIIIRLLVLLWGCALLSSWLEIRSHKGASSRMIWYRNPLNK
jgi:hypothetical protein